MNQIVWMALAATLGTWSVTALGAAMVLFFKSPETKLLNMMLGFASGVMIAASFWSLLQPAIERAEQSGGTPPYLVVTTGFLCGALFMWVCDKIVSYTRGRADNVRGEPSDRLNRIIMLVLSITLHNIPEGLAVGVAFGALADHASMESLMGYSRKKSFLLGQASGIVEPAAGVTGALLVVYVETILPYALSFAAGAMILVAVHELIPECQKNRKKQPYTATMGIVTGFAVMMLLDVMLG